MFGWVPDLGGWEYAMPIIGQGKLIQDSLTGTGNIAEFAHVISGGAAAEEATAQQVEAANEAIETVTDATPDAQAEIDTSQADAIAALTAALQAGNTQFADAQAAQQAMLQPHMDRSNQALTQMGNLSGMGGADAQAQAIAALQSSPQFISMVQQGENALLQNASATGGLRGGNTAAALAQFRPQMLSQQIQQQMANLGGIANFGMNPLAQAAGGVLSTGQGMGANTVGMGQAIAGTNMQGGLANANAGLQGSLTLADLITGRGAAQAAGTLAGYQLPRDFFFDLAGFGVNLGSAVAGGG